MPGWKAYSRAATDSELAESLEAFADRASCWCFVEGPTRSEFVELASAGELVGDSWMVRAFGDNGELVARRQGFDGERPWLLRLVRREPPKGEGWICHQIEQGEQQVLVLFGESDGTGGFVQGQQFRSPFHYPEVMCSEGGRAVLVVERHPAGEGGSIVRWVALRPLADDTSEESA